MDGRKSKQGWMDGRKRKEQRTRKDRRKMKDGQMEGKGRK
jgi:hypothetical protein